MERVRDYIAYLLANIKSNPWIIHEEITFREIDEHELYSKGILYIYGGFTLNIAEYVIVKNNAISCIKYRYHLQDKNEKLIFRWDNAPHHGNISTHPFHVHCHDGTIQPSQEMNLATLLSGLDNILESFITPSSSP